MSSKNDKDLLDTLVKQAVQLKLGRRSFMQGALATGMSLSAASLTWSSRVEAATPKRGGNYRVGMHDGNTSDRLDPGTTESVYMIQMNHAIRSYLTLVTNTNELGGDAAESWESSPDATVWTFNLNPGITFHDGKPLTAADAAASLNYHRGEDTKSAAKALLADVDTIEADGKHRVVVTMKSPNADLPYLMSDYHLVMMAADASGKVDPSSANGTGPYKVERHEPGVRTTLSRHDGFHRDSWFDSIEITAINDPTTRQTAIVTGEVDVISEAELKTVSLLKRQRGVEVDEVPSGAHVTLPMFCDVAPFDNPDVRMALKLACNREELVQKIKRGHASLGNDHPIGPGLPYHADLPQRQYDPDQARALLKKAGAEGLEVTLHAADAAFGGAVDLATLYSEQVKAAGINLKVAREPNDGYWSNVWLNKPFCVVQWGQRPTPDVMFSLAYKHDAAWNESHWNNKRFNELLLQAKGELDQVKRTEMYREMQLLCRDDGGTVMPFFVNRVCARRSNVMHGPNLAGNWEMDGARSFERWWFEDA